MTARRLFILLVLTAAVGGCGGNGNEPPLAPERAARLDEYLPRMILAVIRNPGDVDGVGSDHGLAVAEVLADGVSYRLTTSADADLPALEDELAADPRVSGACLNYLAMDSESRQSSMAFDEGILDEGEYHDQAFTRRLKIAEAHRTSQGEGVVVAILDTGADLDHPVLAGHIHPSSRDFIDRDLDPSDVPDGLDNDGDGLVDEATGHGSHVAGLVALVAPEAELLILRVLNSDGRGSAWAVARAIEYAADAGAQIINLSLGMLERPYVVYEALDYAHDRGVILVSSVGNWGSNSPMEYPSSSRLVWAVAASDSLDRAASFTSYSPLVKLSAPGTRIRSAYWNGGYAVWSGTSMASPLVAGAAALLREEHPTWDASGILNRLLATVDGIAPISELQIGELGAGRLNVGRALSPGDPLKDRKTPEFARPAGVEARLKPDPEDGRIFEPAAGTLHRDESADRQ